MTDPNQTIQDSMLEVLIKKDNMDEKSSECSNFFKKLQSGTVYDSVYMMCPTDFRDEKSAKYCVEKLNRHRGNFRNYGANRFNLILYKLGLFEAGGDLPHFKYFERTSPGTQTPSYRIGGDYSP